MEPIINSIVGLFVPKKDESAEPPSPAPTITIETEDKAVEDESEAEARRRRRGALRRVYTQPGSNFVSQSNIGKNTLTGN